ncbi:hypothetical protein BpHYR1_032267 [Brachionus plicatilis]|uniref:Uncharacterized protein n=1 Tax=Brachionus plicatilis TaxID=10195 RepID=A0A3M7SPN6_BRAPC|nr:hypothetical protein BpHYR1_032267 [Brachionus plicatilis]
MHVVIEIAVRKNKFFHKQLLDLSCQRSIILITKAEYQYFGNCLRKRILADSQIKNILPIPSFTLRTFKNVLQLKKSEYHLRV